MEIPYSVVYDYLHAQKYPDNSEENRKRAIRRKAKIFSIRDGTLYYSSSGKDADQQWIAEKSKQQQIIQSAHGNHLGGHFGRDKTREKITSR